MPKKPLAKKGRRLRGTGTVTQRVDGRWEGRLDLGVVDGKRRYKTYYGKTETEATKLLDDARIDFARGNLNLSAPETLAHFLDRWLELDVKRSVGESTYVYKLQTVRKHIAPSPLGQTKLANLKAPAIQAFLSERQDSGLSPRTVQIIRGIIKQALDRAVAWEYINRNPATATKSPKVPRAQRQALGAEEAKRFLRAISAERLFPMYVLAVTTGLRRGELLGLQWDDIDFERGLLSVRRQLTDKTGPPRLQELKTASSQGSIALSAVELDLLARHRLLVNQEKNALGGAYKDQGMVFCHEDGTFIWPHNFSVRTWRAVRKRAGLPDGFDFHSLRHSSGTVCLELGIPLKVVQERLRHANASMTMGVYQHALPHSQEDAARKLGEFFSDVIGDVH